MRAEGWRRVLRSGGFVILSADTLASIEGVSYEANRKVCSAQIRICSGAAVSIALMLVSSSPTPLVPSFITMSTLGTISTILTYLASEDGNFLSDCSPPTFPASGAARNMVGSGTPPKPGSTTTEVD